MSFRSLLPTDYDDLYEAVASPECVLFERFGGHTPSPDEFVRALWVGVLAQFVPEYKGNSAGLLVAHGAALQDGTVRVTQVARGRFPDEVHAAGLRLFIDYLFRNWELRRLYAEVSERHLSRFLAQGGDVFNPGWRCV